MTFKRGFGLYVHWPFCQAKCPYCDFNSHVSNRVDHRAWSDALTQEIRRSKAEVPGQPLKSIFFGGGTPSLMEPDTVDRVISEARAAWSFANDIEITLEANPTSVEASRFAELADAGVNRVSIGVQSLNAEDLVRLGRLHSVDEARAAIEIANKHFSRVSFDLIYARQDQTLDAWNDELSEALELATGHLSLYQLTIEPGTAFGDRFERGRIGGLPDEDKSADMFNLTQSLTEAAGLKSYEVSNHAKPGEESRHNLIYWQGHDWVGVGPGAHGRYTLNGQRIATETHLSPDMWLAAVANGSGQSVRRVLSNKDAVEERLMMGLRLNRGVKLSECSEYSNKFNYLYEIGMLDIDNETDTVRATANGKLLLNAVIRELLT